MSLDIAIFYYHVFSTILKRAELAYADHIPSDLLTYTFGRLPASAND